MSLKINPFANSRPTKAQSVQIYEIISQSGQFTPQKKEERLFGHSPFKLYYFYTLVKQVKIVLTF